MSSNVDFGKIAFRAVKSHAFAGYAPDLTDMIMDDYVSGGGFQSSFIAIAEETSLSVATAIFDEFLTDEEVQEHTKAWEESNTK